MRELNSDLLIVAEVSRWLRIRPSTIYAWAATGKIPSVKLNGTVRFIRTDIERWINNRSNGPADPHPSATRPIVPPKPTSVSRHAIQQAGARAIRRVTGGQSSQQKSTSGPQLPSSKVGERKDKL